MTHRPSRPDLEAAAEAARTRILVQREREARTINRRFQALERWHQAMAAFTVATALCDDETVALAALTRMFAEDLGYEIARASSADRQAQLPVRVAAGTEAHLAAICARAGDQAYARLHPSDGPLRCVTMFTVASRAAKDRCITVWVASTARTASLHASDELLAPASIERLAVQLLHVFDAVRMRGQLLRERDRLQVAVATATTELRAAVVAAEDARAEAVREAGARREFLASMSHEIRTPMTAILGYAELLVDRGVEEQARLRYAMTIAQSGRHLLAVLDDVLNLAQLEAGKVQAEGTLTPLPQLLLDVHSLMSVRARARGIGLELAFATPLPEEAVLDGDRLRQVLLNLVGNAIKFTDQGGVQLVGAVDGDHLVLDVIDTGVGIPADMLGSVFDRFEQVSSTARRGSGAGLGLAISQRLVGLMHGELTAHSELGRGSRFSVRVPFVPIEGMAQVAAPHVLRRSPEPTTPPRMRGKVLIVDDTPVNRTMLATVLERVGLNVETCGDGAGAIAAVRAAHEAAAPFHLVFLDMQMPVMSGYEAARAMRAMYQDLPIVALTAHAMSGDREQCLEAGCVDYLAKPARRDALFAMVTTYVRQPSGVSAEMPALPSSLYEHAAPADDLIASVFIEDPIIRPLLGEFANDARASFTRLATAVAAGDLPSARSLAHRMRGTAANFGFPDLAGVVGALEHLLHDTSVERTALNTHLALVAAALARLDVPNDLGA